MTNYITQHEQVLELIFMVISWFYSILNVNILQGFTLSSNTIIIARTEIVW